jgi:hypothetical protein
MTLLVGAIQRIDNKHVSTVNHMTSDGSGNNLTPCFATHIDVRQVCGGVKNLSDDFG